jgi:tellurium resistance protein TerD
MAISLTKGQRIEIGLNQVHVGLGWNPNQTGTGVDFDLDSSVFMLDTSGKIPNDEFFVFYNNPVSSDKAVTHSGDDRTGGSSADSDDEIIKIELSKVDPKISEILFIVTIHEGVSRKQNFGQVRNSYIRILDGATNEEICKYELDEDFSVETAVEFGRLYRKNNEWKFEAIGIGYPQDLDYFLQRYQ